MASSASGIFLLGLFAVTCCVAASGIITVDASCVTSGCKPGRICNANGACVCAPADFCNRHRGRGRPVCGSDGEVYASHCELHRAACLAGRRVRPLGRPEICHSGGGTRAKMTQRSSSGTRIPTAVAQPGCPSAEERKAELRDILTARQCQTLTAASGVNDCGIKADSAPLMDRIFAHMDTNSDRLVSRDELLKATGADENETTGCGGTQSVAELLLGRSGALNKSQLADALSLPYREPTTSSSQSVVAAAGSSQFQLTCQLATLNPSEGIRWTRRGVEMASQEVTGRTLTLASVTEADAGVYLCCSALWTSLCDSLTLEVAVQPYVTVHPAMLVRREGDMGQLYCDLRGSRITALYWLYNGEPVNATSLRSDIKIELTDTGSTLTIPRLGRHHTGMYSCRVRNAAGAAEFAGTVYVRQPTDTDYSSYPLSPPTFDASLAVFHAGGYAILDAADCSVKRQASADFDDVILCENLLACSWGPVAAAGRIVYASQPSLGRLLALTPHRWLEFEPVQLNCPPTALSYREQTDQLWVACGAGSSDIFVVEAASRMSTRRGDRRARRWSAGGVSDATTTTTAAAAATAAASRRRVLRLPDAQSDLLVLLTETPTMAEVRVVSEDRGGATRTVRLTGGADWVRAIDRADYLPQGGTLLLHSSSNASQTQIAAIDLKTGAQDFKFFPAAVFADGPTGRLIVSKHADHVLHLTGNNVYVYRVLPSGQLSVDLHDVAGVGITDAQFQANPAAGGLKVLARTAQDGSILLVDLRARVFQLVFDEKLDKKRQLTASDFGDLALIYSRDSAVFFNTTSLTVSDCRESLFVDLQRAHWFLL